MDKLIAQKTIVITSIFHPTEAVVSFSKMTNHHLIVVGDKKTPAEWHCANVEYLSIAIQKSLSFELGKTLPFNHYCRKMLGYLKAIENGAEYIVDTDDDNYPKANWEFPKFESTFDCINSDMGFVNIYQLFTDQKIWPRGLPLQMITKDFKLREKIAAKDCRVGIWQALADEDPDVDAVYRLTSDLPCYFNEIEPVVLDKGTICPFNTQNTIIRKELFVLLYLPTYVTFRFTDILRGLIAQPIMWLYNYQLGFTNATVVQKRNPHNYMDDFISELPMYRYANEVIDWVQGAISVNESIETNLYNAYGALLAAGIVCNEEMHTLSCWINDIKRLQGR